VDDMSQIDDVCRLLLAEPIGFCSWEEEICGFSGRRRDEELVGERSSHSSPAQGTTFTVGDEIVPELQVSCRAESEAGPELQIGRIAKRREYPCEVCGRVFSWRQNRNTHMRLHTNFSPHICSCGRKFKWCSSLKAHRERCNEPLP